MAKGTKANGLLTAVIDAHGGMALWREREKVEATIVSGGGFFPLKGVMQDSEPRRMAVWLHEERSSVLPYGAPDQRTMFTPDRIAIEKLDGTLVAERRDPKDSFAGHQMSTPWDELHRAYFNGEALWTYLTTPFLLALEGVVVEEAETLERGQRNVASASRALSGVSRNPQSGSRFLLRSRSPTAASRLQRQYCRRVQRRATHFGLHRGRRHSSAYQTSRLHAWPWTPADLGHADGIHRHQRSQFHLTD
jgi:hypothetical protein